MHQKQLGVLLRTAAGLALLVCILSPLSVGQTITGAITGTVTDASGAVVTGAKVTASNIETNVVNGATTNDSGIYSFPFLSPGNYTITAENPGFKKAVLGPFRLE